MEKEQPDLGDTPGFAKALAELKRDVPSGEDPLYFDVTKGARLLTREERQQIFEQARGRGHGEEQPTHEQPGEERAVLAPPPGRTLPPPLPAVPDLRPLPTDTIRVRVELQKEPWPLWARAALAGAAFIVLFAAALRWYFSRSPPVQVLAVPDPIAAEVESPSAVAAAAPSVAPSAAATPVLAATRHAPASVPPAEGKTPMRRDALGTEPAAPAHRPKAPSDAPAQRPTIDDPDRY